MALLDRLIARAESIIENHGSVHLFHANLPGRSESGLVWRKIDVSISLRKEGLEVRLRTPGRKPGFRATTCVYFRYDIPGLEPYVNHKLVAATLQNIDRHMVLDDLADV